MRAVILGAGVVGEAVAWDLTRMAPTADVTVVDTDRGRLAVLAERLGVRPQVVDVTDPVALASATADHDIVVGTLPSALGYQVLEQLCRLGARVCDVSFMPERAAMLDALARAHGAVVVADCGVAPGLSHVLAGAGVARLTQVGRIRIDVGGLPAAPVAPFFYKAPFAASDVIEEYTRPVRLVRDGVVTSAEPLSGAETIEVDGIGPLDSFLTDGLRSLADTVKADAMEERTLRHPGHLAVMTALRDAGFFGIDAMMVDGQAVSPRAVTSALLFPHWAYEEGETDVTVLRVDVAGEDADEQPRTFRWQLVDRPDPSRTGTLSSMARTTGFPAAIVARWLAEGRVSAPGVHPPESLGLTGHAEALIAALAHRGVRVTPVA